MRTVRGARDFEAFVAVDPNLDQAICHLMDLPAAAVLAAARGLLAETGPARAHG